MGHKKGPPRIAENEILLVIPVSFVMFEWWPSSLLFCKSGDTPQCGCQQCDAYVKFLPAAEKDGLQGRQGLGQAKPGPGGHHPRVKATREKGSWALA